jgi:hypothetical protein
VKVISQLPGDNEARKSTDASAIASSKKKKIATSPQVPAIHAANGTLTISLSFLVLTFVEAYALLVKHKKDKLELR